MPSSEVRYQRGDVYRPFDEDILRTRRSSSSTTGSSSVLSATKRGGPPRSRHSAISAEIHRSPMQARCSPEEYLTKKKVGVQCKKQLAARSVLIPKWNDFLCKKKPIFLFGALLKGKLLIAEKVLGSPPVACFFSCGGSLFWGVTFGYGPLRTPGGPYRNCSII